MPRELVKIICTAVVAIRDGDRIVGEITSDPVACYREAQLVELWQRALHDVGEANAAEGMLAGGARAQRRRKPPAKK